MPMSNDKYQDRYLEHQIKKKEELVKRPVALPVNDSQSIEEIMLSRRSIRVFDTREIEAGILEYILSTALNSPSSCNRQCISVKILFGQIEKEIAGETLVGGAGWIDKADKIILLFADMNGYKSPAEVSYMPYLDAGVMAMTICYAAENMGIGSCIVNPNIRQEKIFNFQRSFNQRGWRFCCAIALGYPGIKPDRPTKKELSEFILNE